MTENTRNGEPSPRCENPVLLIEGEAGVGEPTVTDRSLHHEERRIKVHYLPAC